MYLGPVERAVWEEINKLGAIERIADLSGRVWELDRELRFVEFERDQAREAYQQLKERV